MSAEGGTTESARGAASRSVPASSSIWQQAIRFALTTGLSAALSFGLPVALVELFGFDERRAVQIGFACAYIVNIVVVRSFVYRSRNHWARDFLAYVVVNGLFRLLEYAGFVFLQSTLGVPYAAALLVVLIASTIVKFFVYRFVFR